MKEINDYFDSLIEETPRKIPTEYGEHPVFNEDGEEIDVDHPDYSDYADIYDTYDFFSRFLGERYGG